MQPFDLNPKRVRPRLIEPDLALVQGWGHNPRALRVEPHPQPSLLTLELMRDGTETGLRFEVRGADATVGRYSPMTGPVDIDLGCLQDHERFRIGLPHLRLALRDGVWRAEPLTWAYPTLLEGEVLRGDGGILQDHQLLALGNALFRVHVHARAVAPLSYSVSRAGLRLKFDGAPSGLVAPLEGAVVLVGRSSPETGGVDLDLGGLPDGWLVTVARRHARFFPHPGGWCVESLGARGPVTINRHAAIRDVRALSPGDEVALGNVIFVYERSEISAGDAAASAGEEGELG